MSPHLLAIQGRRQPPGPGSEPDGCGEDRTWPVGSRPANAWGLFDLRGNAGEWTGIWYDPNAIGGIYATGDLKGPPSGKRRVTLGGSWNESGETLRSSFCNTKPAQQGDAVYGSIGFRCANP